MAIVRLSMARASARRKKSADHLGQPIYLSRPAKNIDGGKATGSNQENPLYTRLVDPSSAGWPAMYRVVRESDTTKVDDCRDDIDTLLVFAGLYSAVLSAFLIESYKNLQEDKQDTIVGLLEKIATQNFVSSGRYTNSTTILPSSTPFEPPSWAIRVNVLWFASLVLSIAVASLGILVKQWLREYLAMEYSSPRSRLRARNYRKPALDDWKVFEIAAILPMILQISVGLFFVGLCVFTSAVHESVRDTTIPIVCAWAFFFFITTIAPLFSPRCPFKTAFLKRALKTGRRFIAPYVRRVTISISWNTARLYEKILHQPRTGPGDGREPRTRPTLEEVLEDEEDAVKGDAEDTQVLLAVDAVVADDSLLPTMLEVLLQRKKPETIVEFMLKFIRQRQMVNSIDTGVEKLDFTPDIGMLSTQACTTLIDALVDLLTRNIEDIVEEGKILPWARNSTVLLLSTHSKSDVGIQSLRNLIQADSAQEAAEAEPTRHGRAEILFSVEPNLVDDSLLVTMLDLCKCRGPRTTVDFVLRIVRHRTGVSLPEGTLSSVIDLSELSPPTWTVIVRALADILARNRETLSPSSNQTPSWAIESTILLLSHRRPAEPLLTEHTFVDDPLLVTMLNVLRHLDPQIASDFVMRIVRHRARVDPPTEHLTSIVDLSELSLQIRTTLAGVVADLLLRHGEILSTMQEAPPWAINSIALLLSRHAHAGLLHSIDFVLVDELLLPTMLDVCKCTDPTTTMDFILKIVRHRTDIPIPEVTFSSIPDLSTLSSPTWNALIRALINNLNRNRETLSPRDNQTPSWAINSTILLLSHHGNDTNGLQALRTLFESENGLKTHPGHHGHVELLSSVTFAIADDSLLKLILGLLRGLDPDAIFAFALRVIQHRTGVDLLDGNISSILDLSELSPTAWAALVRAFADMLTDNHEALFAQGEQTPSWAINCTTLLLSRRRDGEDGVQALREFIECGSIEGERSINPAHHGYAKLLLSVDPLLIDDSLLPVLLDLLERQTPETIVDFILQLVRCHAVGAKPLEKNFTSVLDLHALSSHTWTTLVSVLANLLKHNRKTLSMHDIETPPWAITCIILLLSHRDNDDNGALALREFIESDDVEGASRIDIAHHGYAELLFSIDPILIDDTILPKMLDILKHQEPGTVIDFLLRLVRHRRGVGLPHTDSAPTLALRGPSDSAYRALPRAVCTLLPPHALAPLEDVPQWKLDAIVFLLSVSSHDLPDEYAQALHQIIVLDAAFHGAANSQGDLIADRLSKSWNSAPEFVFSSIARLYASLGSGSASSTRPYAILLDCHHSEGKSVVEPSGAAYPHPSLLRLLTHLLMWRCQLDDELTAGEYEALQVVLEIGVSDVRTAETDEVLKVFYEHPIHVYAWMACYSSMKPVNLPIIDLPLRTLTHGSFRAFRLVFENPYNPARDLQLIAGVHAKLLVHVVAMLDNYCETERTTYTWALNSLDLVRLCNLYLQTWVSRVARLSPNTRDVPPSLSWSKIWSALARGIVKYYQCKAWDYPAQNALPWESASSWQCTPDSVFNRDVEHALDCMRIIHQWRGHMGFAMELERALGLFIGRDGEDRGYGEFMMIQDDNTL